MSAPVSEKELAEAVDKLPPVAVVMQRLLVVLQDPNSDVDDIARLVRADTALSTKVLKLANSAHFGLSSQVSMIDEAIQHIGVNEIYRLVSALSGQQLMARALDRYAINANLLWQHTLAVAVSSEVIAGTVGVDASAAYVGGILHPIGFVALDTVATARGTEVRPTNIALLDWERENFGDDNSAAAARVMRYWKFPEDLAVAVGARYEPPTAETVESCGAVLYLASCVAERIPAGLPPEGGLFRVSPEMLEMFRLTSGDYADIELTCRQKISRLRTLLKLA